MKLLTLSIDGTTIAAPSGVPTGGLGQGEIGQRIITFVIQGLLIVGILLSIFFLLFGAIQWITSGGDKQKIQTARNKVVFAIVGLIVILAAFFILNIVQHFFGVNDPCVPWHPPCA